MSGQQHKVLVPPPINEPRGAVWAAAALVAIGELPGRRLQAMGAAFRGLRGRLAAGAPGSAEHPRSEAELLALAREVEPESPALAAELRVFALHRGTAAAPAAGATK